MDVRQVNPEHTGAGSLMAATHSDSPCQLNEANTQQRGTRYNTYVHKRKTQKGSTLTRNNPQNILLSFLLRAHQDRTDHIMITYD